MTNYELTNIHSVQIKIELVKIQSDILQDIKYYLNNNEYERAKGIQEGYDYIETLLNKIGNLFQE
jgi:hypothetical protein